MGPYTALTRFIRRIRQAEDGEVHWFKESRHRGEMFRVGLIFATTILVPSILLAYFALSSSRSDELALDLELRQRSEAIASQIQRDLSTTFQQFEQATLARLALNQSPLNHLTELSPFLRLTLRFDRTGALVAPFGLENSPPVDQPSTSFRTGHSYALRLEQQREYRSAALHFQAVADIGREPMYIGEAKLGAARALWKAGDLDSAKQIFAALQTEASLRDRYGFRLRDLAVLKHAEFQISTRPRESVLVIRQLIDQILTERWTIGRPGEAAIARRAISTLEGLTDPDWLARARTRLEERSVQFHWAQQIRDELELFGGTQIRGTPGQFQYYARPESPAVWSSVVANENLYTFAFSAEALLGALALNTGRASEVDDDLTVSLIDTDRIVHDNQLAIRSLGPWIPYVSVIVEPADVEALRVRKSQQRRVRLLIIGLAILTVVVGIIATAQLITREIETAWEKTDFAANVSHELRSPITQIRLKGEALMYGLVFDEDDRQAHYDAIVRESERLSRLVDNVLDFAAIERGAKTYSLRPSPLDEVIASSVEACQGFVDKSGCTLELDINENLPAVWIDRDAISQVLINLISNAAKYGAEGKWIGLRANLGDDHVIVEVADRGMGINSEDLKHIFEHFYRSTDQRVRKKKGTGIGLAIVRYIMEAHGGSVSAESAPGNGTSFTVQFPLRPPDSLGA